MSSSGWGEALDAFALALAEQRRAFAEGRYGDITPFLFPEEDLPDALRPRAQQLLHDSWELEEAVATGIDELARRSAEVTRRASRARRASTGRRGAAFFDSVA